MQNSANTFVSSGFGWHPKSCFNQTPKNLQNSGFANLQRAISDEELERFAEASASFIPEPLAEQAQAEYTILKEYDLAKDPFGVYRMQITTRNEKPFVNIARFYQVRETGYYQPTRKQIWLPIEAWRGLCLRIGAVNQELKKQLNGQSIFAGGNRNASGGSASIASMSTSSSSKAVDIEAIQSRGNSGVLTGKGASSQGRGKSVSSKSSTVPDRAKSGNLIQTKISPFGNSSPVTAAAGAAKRSGKPANGKAPAKKRTNDKPASEEKTVAKKAQRKLQQQQQKTEDEEHEDGTTESNGGLDGIGENGDGEAGGDRGNIEDIEDDTECADDEYAGDEQCEEDGGHDDCGDS